MRRYALLGLVAAWLLYEIVMAVLLRGEFGWRDWAALTYKILFLVVAGLHVYRDSLDTACSVAPAYAGAVRAAGGWLSYTWFTVMAPLLGALLCILAGDRGRGLWLNLGYAAFMALTLAGRVYTAPGGLAPDMVVGLAAGVALSLYLARGRWAWVAPAPLAAASWIYPW